MKKKGSTGARRGTEKCPFDGVCPNLSAYLATHSRHINNLCCVRSNRFFANPVDRETAVLADIQKLKFMLWRYKHLFTN